MKRALRADLLDFTSPPGWAYEPNARPCAGARPLAAGGRRRPIVDAVPGARPAPTGGALITAAGC